MDTCCGQAIFLCWSARGSAESCAHFYWIHIRSGSACFEHGVACSQLQHFCASSGSALCQPATDEHMARNHPKEAYLQSVEDIFDLALHGNAALSVVYGSRARSCLGGLMMYNVHCQASKPNTAICCCSIRSNIHVAHFGQILQPLPSARLQGCIVASSPLSDLSPH